VARHRYAFAHPGTLVALAAATLLACTARLAAQTPAPAPVTVTASGTPTEVTIGDPIRYVVEVAAAADTELIVPVLAGQVGDFTITDFGEVAPRRDQGRLITARWYTLTIFDTGDHIIPAPTVQYRVPGEELQEAKGNEVLIGVTSLLAREANASDIRDVKPPEAVPFDWRPYGVVAAILAAAALLLAGFVYLLNRPRRAYVVPPRPPFEVALAALNRLHAQHLIEEGRFEAFYVELSAIVRRYLEDGFHVHAPEMTTEEFLAVAARDPQLAAAHRRLLATFLAEADLVKFARYLPTLRDSEAAYAAARRFIEETQPAAPSGSAEVRDAAA
jgi:hypothetical protein